MRKFELSKQFYHTFTQAIQMDRVQAERYWLHDKDFTNYIIPLIRKVISVDINNNQLETQTEYFRIDACAWEQKRDGSLLKDIPSTDNYALQEYAWNLIYAVEHENDSKLWMDEVIKLAHVACDLRVVIGYFPYHIKHKQNEYLKRVSDRILKLKIKDNMNRGEFLILLGDCGYSQQESDKWLTYTPYVFTGREFTRLYNV